MKPIVVDLDNSLIKTDILHEAAIQLLKKQPFLFFLTLFSLRKGILHFKKTLSKQIELDIDSLPINKKVEEWCREKDESGIPCYLVTGTHQIYAEKFYDIFPFFKEITGSTQYNLTGKNKANFLLEKFGEGHFEYIGDSKKDLFIWNYASKSHIVSDNKKLIKKVPNLGEVFGRDESKLKVFFKAIRVHQWSKNLILLVPILASHKYYDPSMLTTGIISFFSFSFMASAIYLLNDLLDLPSDRIHKTKKKRPLASGDLSIPLGIISFITFILFSFLLSLQLPFNFSLILITYFSFNIAYSFKLKKLPIIDIFLLTSFYILRLMGGGFATQIVISQWLQVFSFFFFFSLSFLKRYIELYQLYKVSGRTEASGRGYNINDLSQISNFGISSGCISILIFCLYINQEQAKNIYKSPFWLWGLCLIMLLWIINIWFKAGRGQVGEDPVKYAIKDKGSLMMALFGIFILILARG